MPNFKILLIFTCLSWALSASVFANTHANTYLPHKVALITSYDTAQLAAKLPGYLGFLRSSIAHSGMKTEMELEKTFRDQLENEGYEIEVYHQGNLAILSALLHSPDYAGIYWVSHGLQKGSADGGLLQGGILDKDEFDISPLLSEIHPNLRVLGLITCYSSQAFKSRTLDQQLAKTNPHLMWLTFPREVDAVPGLKVTIQTSLSGLKRPPPVLSASEACPSRQGYYLGLTRTCHEDGPAIYLQGNGRLLATFTSCKKGQTQSISGHLDVTAQDLEDIRNKDFDPAIFDILVATGSKPISAIMLDKAPYLGEISIDPIRLGRDDLGTWRPLSLRKGDLVGVSQHIYTYVGQPPAPYRLTDYRPFTCAH
ncbi:hypothetical protein WDW37_02265 [Bdellovibrionota bacterium FG-1]